MSTTFEEKMAAEVAAEVTRRAKDATHKLRQRVASLEERLVEAEKNARGEAASNEPLRLELEVARGRVKELEILARSRKEDADDLRARLARSEADAASLKGRIDARMLGKKETSDATKTP